MRKISNEDAKNTKILSVDPENPESDINTIDEAASVIIRGGIVAFPTETVYGLGANALDSAAVRKIFEAKGRPQDNPLIVHISDESELLTIVKAVPDAARKLMEEFWPGPLTIVLQKTDRVPAEVSGGLDTVAVRMPSNNIARLFIRRCGLPIAAPSANSSGKPSPTRASHVAFDLNGKIDVIIDGGGAEYGLESTIVDVTGKIPCLLRPGSVTRESIEELIGRISVDPAVMGESRSAPPKAPGMRYTHYSPLAKVTIVTGEEYSAAKEINKLAENSRGKVGILATEQTKSFYDVEKYCVLNLGDRNKPETIGANLYKMLRKFDFYGVEEIFSEGVGESELGLAIMNRLNKAAGYRIIEV